MLSMKKTEIPTHLLKFFKPRHVYKPKDDAMIPHRVYDALMADGWWGRSDIIWSKINCMPESVTDRPTSAHEHIFLLAKSERYFYDAEAIAESCSETSHGGNISRGGQKQINLGRNVRSSTLGPTALQSGRGSRNKRNVWSIASSPYSEAHFATFPPKLIEPCILAGSRPGDIVLDPFMGAGTTSLVAIQHGRDYLGIELNPAYVALAERRIACVQTHLWSVTESEVAG